MTILFVCVVLLVICWGLALRADDCEDFLFLLGCIPAIAIVVGLIAIPLNRMDADAQLARIIAIQSTQADNSWQDAAWRAKAAEANADLAEMQYWNHTAFDIWWPDAVDKVKPIQRK